MFINYYIWLTLSSTSGLLGALNEDTNGWLGDLLNGTNNPDEQVVLKSCMV